MCCMASFQLRADDVDLLAKQTDASVVSLGFSSLRSLTFRLEGSSVLTQIAYMDVNKVDGTVKSYDLKTIDYLYFGPLTDKIVNVTAQPNNKLSWRYDGNKLYVNAAAGRAGLYSVDGSCLASGTIDATQAALQVGKLRSGLYLLRVGNKTDKIMIR
jgi:hypothetical protein